MPYVLYGAEDGFAKPVLLNDRNGNLMHAGRFWDPTSKKHTSGKGPGDRAYSALPVDFDGDGDFDLVVGTNKGGLYLRVNEGTKTAPAFASKMVAIRAGGKNAVVPSGYAMPVAADWDGDGRFDLISGSSTGTVYWFRNIGDEKPEFETPKSLTGASSGQRVKGPTYRSQVDVADFDGDGDLDLLVGDYTRVTGDGKTERHGWIWLYRQAGSSAADSGEKQARPAKN